MNSLVLAARLHSLEGAREDIAKAIESWHMTKARLSGKTAFTDDMQARDARAAARAEATMDQRNEDQAARATRLRGRITDADRAKVDQIVNQNNAQSNVDGSSKGVDNPAQYIKDRFDRREAGNPSMGDKMRQQFGKVRQQVGDFRQRMGAKASEGLSEAGQMIGDAATAAKEKMGELGQRTDDAMMGAARSLGRGVGTARAKGSEMMDSAKEKAGQMGAKASELGGSMLDAAKRMGQGAMGTFSNVAGRVPGMMQAAKKKAGEIGAGVMGAAGQAGRGAMNLAGQAGRGAMNLGRGAMNMASQLPGQVSGAVQGAMYGSQGGANRGGAYLPGVGGRISNFASGVREGGLQGLREQGIVGTTRRGQQSRYGIGAQESKDMRRLYDQNQTLGRRDSAMQGLTPEQQAAYSYDPSSQPAPQGGQDMDGDGQPDVKQTVELNGQTGEQKQTTTITPQPMTPAGTNTGGGGGGGQGGSLFDLAPEQYRNTGGGGGGQGGQVAGNLGGGNIAQASSNSSGNTVNVYGGGGQGGGQAPAQPQQNLALDALTADAAQRASKTGGMATNVGLGLLTGGLSNIGGALYNRRVRRQGERDLKDLANQYRKSDEMASTLRVRQDIEKGRLGDFINSIRSGGMRMTDDGIEQDRANRRRLAIQRIQRGANFNPKTRGKLTNEQYEGAADEVEGLYQRRGPNVSAFSSPPPAPAPAPIPAVVPEGQPVERRDILERSEPWTVVENPFANPFYSQNAFDLRKEPAPEAEIEKSVIEDFVTEEAPVEQEVNLQGFDTVDGDDLSLLPASVFAKSNPVGDNMSLLPSGWGQDAE